MNNFDNVFSSLTIHIGNFTMGSFFADSDGTLRLEFHEKIIPAALKALENCRPQSLKADKLQVMRAINTLLTKHPDVLKEDDVKIYFLALKQMLGEAKAFRKLLQCLLARKNQVTACKWIQEDLNLSKQAFFNLAEKVNRKKTVVNQSEKELLQLFMRLPFNLALQDLPVDLKTLQSAGVALGEARIFTRPLFDIAIDSSDESLIALLCRESISVDNGIRYLLKVKNAPDAALKKMEQKLLTNQEFVQNAIVFIVNRLKDQEMADAEFAALLQKLIQTSPMIDSYVLDLEGIAFLHRSGYFMTMPGLFKIPPLEAAAAKLDIPRIAVFLAIDGNDEGLKGLSKEQITELLMKIAVSEGDGSDLVVQRLVRLEPLIDIDPMSEHQIAALFQLFQKLQIPLDIVNLFKANPLKKICSLEIWYSPLIGSLVFYGFAWDEVPISKRRDMCWFLLERCLKEKWPERPDNPELRIPILILRTLLLSRLELDPGSFTISHFYLLQFLGLPINPQGAFWESPLLNAFKRKDAEKIGFLLAYGSNIRELWPSITEYPSRRCECDPAVYDFFQTLEELRIPKLTTFGDRNKAVVKKLIEMGAKLVVNGEFEDSLLAWVLSHSCQTKANKQFIDFLLKSGFSLNQVNGSGQNLILWALSNRYMILFQNCLEFGVDINCIDNDLHGPMYHAIKANIDPHYAKLLFDRGPVDWNVSYEGRTVLHLAVRSPDFDFLESLIQKGCNANIILDDGDPLLTAAIKKRNWRLVTLIMNRNPDLTLKNRQGRTPFAAAFDYEAVDLLFEMLDKGATGFDCKKIDPPLEQIADRPRVITEGESLLIWASDLPDRSLELMNQLIEKGASINMVNNRGETLLHHAVKKKNSNLIDYCLQKGANVNCRNNDGDTPLMYALLLGLDDICLLLLEKGASLYEYNEYGIAPITHVGALQRFPPVQTNGPSPKNNSRQLIYFSKNLNEKHCVNIETRKTFAQIMKGTSFGQHLLLLHPNGLTPQQAYDLLFQNCREADTASQFESLLEFALVLDFRKMTRLIAEKLEVHAFSKMFADIVITKQRQLPKKYWLDHLVAINPAHFSVNLNLSMTPAVIPAAETPQVDISQLLAYFDAINTTDPSGADYFDPKILMKGEFVKKRDRLRKHLSDLICDAVNKKSTRKFENPEEDLKKLHALLSEIAAFCANWSDTRQRAYFILEIAKEAENCGVGWVMTVNNLKTLLDIQTKGVFVPKSLEESLYYELMMFRAGKIEMLSGANVHARNQWLQAIGSYANVPEAKNLGKFGDAYRFAPLDQEVCKQKFLKSYYPSLLVAFATKKITATLKEERQQSEHSTVLHWFESHIPDDFKKELYDNVKREIQANPEAWQAIFTKFNLAFNPAWKSGEEALEKVKKADFTAQVFPQFSEVPELAAVVYMLIRLNVLTECLPGAVDAVSKSIKAHLRMEAKRKSAEKDSKRTPKALKGEETT